MDRKHTDTRGDTTNEESIKIDTRSNEDANVSRRSDYDIAEWVRRKKEKRVKSKAPIYTKRKRLNQVSSKQGKKNSAYSKAKKEVMNESSVCQLCGTNQALSIHHLGKRLNNISNKEDFMILCLIGDFMDKANPHMNHSHSGGCHGFVEGNKKWARQNNYLK